MNKVIKVLVRILLSLAAGFAYAAHSAAKAAEHIAQVAARGLGKSSVDYFTVLDYVQVTLVAGAFFLIVSLFVTFFFNRKFGAKIETNTETENAGVNAGAPASAA